MAAPLTGEPCMIGGISEEWPTEGSCYCFNPANGASFVSSEEWFIISECESLLSRELTPRE